MFLLATQKRNWLLGTCSSLRLWKGPFGGTARKQEVARTHQQLALGGIFFFCQEQVILSQSWAGTREKRLVRSGGPWLPPGRRVSEGAL